MVNYFLPLLIQQLYYLHFFLYIQQFAMSEKISDSIKYLLLEYTRLKKKKKKMELSLSEKFTLQKLEKFLGKS